VRDIFDEDHAAFAESFRSLLDREWGGTNAIARIGEAGLLGMDIPEEYGGGGVRDPRFCAVAIEELVRAGRIGHAFAYATHAGVGQSVLAEYGSPDQQLRWLPALAAGESTIAVATELVSGTAIEGGDTVALVGRCRIVLNGESASVALVPVRVDGENVVRLAAIEPTAPGVSRDRVDGLALAGAALGELIFEGAKIPQSALLPAAAFAHTRTALRLWGAVIAVAGARVAIDWTWIYVRERTVFGRPVAAFENTRHVLGGLSAELVSAQTFIDCCVQQHGANNLTAAAAAAAKLISSHLFWHATDEGLQLHGGYGYMREYPISALFADSRLLRWLPESDESLHLELACDLNL
jgi:alkylation response protein AidB-like acyl-CoA dehydrogenase